MIYTNGQSIEIEIYNYSLKKSEWVQGIFLNKVSALDRSYRIHCKTNDGREISEAAPECVRPL